MIEERRKDILTSKAEFCLWENSEYNRKKVILTHCKNWSCLLDNWGVQLVYRINGIFVTWWSEEERMNGGKLLSYVNMIEN